MDKPALGASDAWNYSRMDRAPEATCILLASRGQWRSPRGRNERQMHRVSTIRHPAAAEKRKGVSEWITICSIYVLWIASLCTGFALLIRWLGS